MDTNTFGYMDTNTAELGTLEWWISGLMLDPFFFLISKLLVFLMNLISRLINRSGLRISHSKVFSSGYMDTITPGYVDTNTPGHMDTNTPGDMNINTSGYMDTKYTPGYKYTLIHVYKYIWIQEYNPLGYK